MILSIAQMTAKKSAKSSVNAVVAKLSKDRIVDVALEICETEGFEAISMRRLASQLGVTPMALYKHVSTKHDLLNLIADRYLEPVVAMPHHSEEWRISIFEAYSALRDLMIKRPVLAHIIITQPLDGSTAYKIAEILLSILRNAGFSNEETGEMSAVFASFALGFTMQDLARIKPQNQKVLIKRRTELKQFPNLSAVADRWEKSRSDRHFKSALKALIDSYGCKLQPKKKSGEYRKRKNKEEGN